MVPASHASLGLHPGEGPATEVRRWEGAPGWSAGQATGVRTRKVAASRFWNPRAKPWPCPRFCGRGCTGPGEVTREAPCAVKVLWDSVHTHGVCGNVTNRAVLGMTVPPPQLVAESQAGLSFSRVPAIAERHRGLCVPGAGLGFALRDPHQLLFLPVCHFQSVCTETAWHECGDGRESPMASGGRQRPPLSRMGLGPVVRVEGQSQTLQTPRGESWTRVCTCACVPCQVLGDPS